MNWQLDINNPYVWQIEGTPFGVEKIDSATYAPFRMWNKSRVYVGKYTDEGRSNLTFKSRNEAFAYVEAAVREYRASIIAAV